MNLPFWPTRIMLPSAAGPWVPTTLPTPRQGVLLRTILSECVLCFLLGSRLIDYLCLYVCISEKRGKGWGLTFETNQSLWPFATCLNHFLLICPIAKETSEGKGRDIEKREKNRYKEERNKSYILIQLKNTF